MKASPPRDASGLPPGWSRIMVQRKGGVSAGKFDVYIFRFDSSTFIAAMGFCFEEPVNCTLSFF